MTRLRLAILLPVLALAACGAAPKRDLDRERIEAELARLEADADLAPRAGAEIARARDAVRQLAAAAGAREAERAELAYVAERRVDIAYAAAQAARDEERLAQLEREADAIRLEATRRDAELARLEAEKLRVQNLAKAEEAERARRPSRPSGWRRRRPRRPGLRGARRNWRWPPPRACASRCRPSPRGARRAAR
jgi:hypothetical protein